MFLIDNFSSNHNSKRNVWKIGSEAFKYAKFDLDFGRNSEFLSNLSRASILALSNRALHLNTLLLSLHT